MASSASASAVVRNLQVVRTKVAQAVAASARKQQVHFVLLSLATGLCLFPLSEREGFSFIV